MAHPFMTSMQDRLTHLGHAVALFNFPYTERGRRAPDRGAVLEECYRSVVEHLRVDEDLRPSRLFIGGKSMGGRIATQIAAGGLDADGLVLLGYPLQPPGKPEKMRCAHLTAVAAPLLFLQGTRDSICNLNDLQSVLNELRGPVKLHVIAGGDHAFQVLKRSGRNQEEVLDELADVCADWIGAVIGGRPEH